MKMNSSRREFLTYFGMVALVLSIPTALFSSTKTEQKEEYIVVDGWLLKRGDLNDI